MLIPIYSIVRGFTVRGIWLPRAAQACRVTSVNILTLCALNAAPFVCVCHQLVSRTSSMQNTMHVKINVMFFFLQNS